MKYALAVGLAVMLGLAGVTTGYGQTAMPSTPTTKILAIGSINPGVEPKAVFAMLPEEVRDTANLYLDGKIDQWYSQQNGKGVVFILNITDPTAAHDILEKLPLGRAHLMSFELIPLGPLAPLRRLPGMATKP